MVPDSQQLSMNRFQWSGNKKSVQNPFHGRRFVDSAAPICLSEGLIQTGLA